MRKKCLLLSLAENAGSDKKFYILCHRFTLISILPSSSSREFLTRMFSSFKSRCTISVGCEEESLLHQRKSSIHCVRNAYLQDQMLLSIFT